MPRSTFWYQTIPFFVRRSVTRRHRRCLCVQHAKACITRFRRLPDRIWLRYHHLWRATTTFFCSMKVQKRFSPDSNDNLIYLTVTIQSAFHCCRSLRAHSIIEIKTQGLRSQRSTSGGTCIFAKFASSSGIRNAFQSARQMTSSEPPTDPLAPSSCTGPLVPKR